MNHWGEYYSDSDGLTKRKTNPNNRPITRLPMMWKILTTQIKEINYSLIFCGFFSIRITGKKRKEKKRSCKGARGINDLLFQDQNNLKQAKTRQKNVAMVLIDFKKANDIVM